MFLESVLLEIRANDWQRAAAEAQEALRVHSGAGRLWAVLVQLKQRDSDEAQQASLKQACLSLCMCCYFSCVRQELSFYFTG